MVQNGAEGVATGGGNGGGRFKMERIVGLVVSIFICLASGTIYLYGVYAPQFVEKIGLTASDSAVIALATNIGSGIGGLPAGLVIDHEGPQLSILIGSVAVFGGYFGLYKIYQLELGSLVFSCVCMICVGFGSVISYFATMKAAQANFPQNRGVAGAFPVSSFGLSATLFSVIAATFFRNNVGGFLKFVSFFCSSTMILGSWFVQIYVDHEEPEEDRPFFVGASSTAGSILDTRHGDWEEPLDFSSRNNSYSKLSSYFSDTADSLKGSLMFWGIGQRTPRSSMSSPSPNCPSPLQLLIEPRRQDSQAQRAPLLPRNSSMSITNNEPSRSGRKEPKGSPIDVIKFLLTNKLFLAHYFLVSFTSGIGQMYIFSVGFIVKAQVFYGAPTDLLKNLELQGKAAALQALQVSIISIASFSGRLGSGFLSDFIHKRFHVQRLWIISFTIIVSAVGQYISMTNVDNPHILTATSAIIGVCYGMVFGTYPAVIADKFGTKTFSTTWGLVCTGPLLVLYLLNKYFGIVYDRNTDPGTGICYKGNGCYKEAFKLSGALCFVIFITSGLLLRADEKKHPLVNRAG